MKSRRKIHLAALRRTFTRVSRGSSLMEMVIVLAILSLLAAIATPYARMSIKREKEMQLRETLRTVRTAIDRFHADMDGATNKKENKYVSENGYPLSLQVLIDGVEVAPQINRPETGWLEMSCQQTCRPETGWPEIGCQQTCRLETGWPEIGCPERRRKSAICARCR